MGTTRDRVIHNDRLCREEHDCESCKHRDVRGIDEPCIDCGPCGCKWEPQDEPVSPPEAPAADASSTLRKAADLIEERGKQRDSEDGERSMARTVRAFNAMTGHSLSEEEGWQFMVFLKHARMRAGGFTPDDYDDSVAYQALMAECAFNTNKE